MLTHILYSHWAAKVNNNKRRVSDVVMNWGGSKNIKYERYSIQIPPEISFFGAWNKQTRLSGVGEGLG